MRTPLILALVLAVGTLGAQNEADSSRHKTNPFSTWSVGLRVLHLYDMNDDRFNTPTEIDPYGLNGENTSFDLGFDVYLEKMLTPMLGLQARYRYGSITGANPTQYYEGTFHDFSVRANFILSNLDRRRVDSKWNFLATLGGGLGYFDSQRFLINGDIPNGDGIVDAYIGYNAGLGAQYLLNDSWRLDLDVSLNAVLDDGFDGFDAKSGFDAYVNTGIGVAYTFGASKDKPAMYATNYFEEPYMIDKEARAAEELEKKMKKQDSALAADIEENGKEIGKVQDNLALAQQNDAKRFRAIEESRVEETKDAVHVYFEIESAALSPQAKKVLIENLYGQKKQVTLTAYADRTGSDGYNQQLKQRRAESVKDFIVEVIGYDAGKLTIEMGDPLDVGDNYFLNRKVKVEYQN